ncbi:PIN domain-containing protein [Candidatus Micrarchaeota archaeon]|nr:PIN domain-containing protein [Candidatus Micrarchaeota archaeon]
MYFLDTCALLGYLKGEKRFERIVESGDISVSRFQLMELYYIALRELGEELAEKYYEAFSRYEVEIEEHTLKNAMKKRLEMQGKGLNVSYVDALGYQYSIDKEMEFVTSDPAFRKLKGVIFVPIE